MNPMLPAGKPVAARRQAWPRRLRLLLLAALASFLILYLGLSALVAHMLSRPVRGVLGNTPAVYELPYEEVLFYSREDRIPLSGWYIDSTGSEAIVMLHGLNGIRDAGDSLAKAEVLAEAGYDVLMFDFRGHGQSGGERLAMGMWETRDVAGAVDWVKARGATAIGLYGVSMGAATALLAAPDLPEVRAVLADSPFADLPAILENELPRSSRLPAFYNPGIYFMGRLLFGIDLSEDKPIRAMERLADRPILLIHSSGDQLIPVSHAHAFERAGAGNPHFESWIVPGGWHVSAFLQRPAEYKERMLAFYDGYLR